MGASTLYCRSLHRIFSMPAFLHHLLVGFIIFMASGLTVGCILCIRVALNSDGAWRLSLLKIGGIGLAAAALAAILVYWLW